MKTQVAVLAVAALLECGFCQNITFLADSGKAGPELEVVHAYYGQWPTGI